MLNEFSVTHFRSNLMTFFNTDYYKITNLCVKVGQLNTNNTFRISSINTFTNYNHISVESLTYT